MCPLAPTHVFGCRCAQTPAGSQGEEVLDGAAGSHAHGVQAPASKRSKGTSSQSHASASEGPDGEGDVASSSASTAIVPLGHSAAAHVAAAADLLRPSLAILGGAAFTGSGAVPSIVLPHAVQPGSQRPLLPPCGQAGPIPHPPASGSGPRGLLLLTQHPHSSQRTSQRQASKRRGRQPGVESDDSNISTDSHTQAQHEACSSHDEDEHGRCRPPTRPFVAGAGGAGPLADPPMAAGAAFTGPLLLLPAPPRSSDGVSPRVSGDGLQAQPSTESIDGSPVATAVAGGGPVIYLPHRTSRGPRSRASSATPGSSFGS